MNFLTSVGLVFCAISALAQPPEASRRFRFGLSVGLTGTHTEVTKYPTPQASVESHAAFGYRVGGLGTYGFSRRFFVSMHVSYFRMNAELTTRTTLLNGFTITGSMDHFNEWIEVPLELNYIFNPGSKLRVFAGAGMSLMYLAATEKDSYSDLLGVDQMELRQSFNSAVLVEVGVDAALNPGVLRVSLLADQTLGAVVKPRMEQIVCVIAPCPGPFESPPYDFRYSTLTMRVAYLF